MISRDTPREEVLHFKRIKSKRTGEDEKSSFKAVTRTAEILQCLQRHVMTVTELADALGIHKSTSHRLLQAMEKSGLVIRNKLNRRYYIGPLISELASDPDVTHEYFVSCALNPMKRLAELTGESIGLSVLIGLSWVLLYEIPSIYDLQIVAKKKIVNNLHAGSGGKILLAQLGPRELNIAVSNLDFKPMTERTITSKEELLAQIDRIREQGYAMSYGERISEAMDICVPIKNYFVPAFLGILGPENRMKPKTEEFLNFIRDAGAHIEKNIAEALT
jgi:IclR family KDG regulon transcriptional repressor